MQTEPRLRKPTSPGQQQGAPSNKPDGEPEAGEAKRRIGWKILAGIAAIVVAGAVGIVALFLLLVPAGGQLYEAGDLWLDESGDPVNLPVLSEPSKVFAADGALLAQFQAEINREPIPLADVPEHVQQAILAIEDDEFYNHEGVDFAAIGRAFVSNFRSGGISQGGSTISQQVVKNSFLLDEEGQAEQTLERKVKEAFIALRLERRFTKQQILERYVNSVYLGNGTYGIQAAARTYFNKNAIDLDVPEAALLAGLIASPAKWDPLAKPAEAINRRGQVLDRMVEEGYITEQDKQAFDQAPLPVMLHEPPDISESDDYFVEAVKQELLQSDEFLPGDKQDRFDQIFYGGLEIHTTLDPRLQQAATDVIEGNSTIQAQRARGITEDRGYTAAIASVDVKTGRVLALYGGDDFETRKFNLATQGKRQTGSSMKIYGLTAALERGYSPNDVLDGTSGCRYNGVRDSPSVSSVGGVMTLWQGTYRSSNCVYVNLVNDIGAQAVVDTAHKLGITSQLDPNPSIILGALTYGVTPLEHAHAYSTIANDGLRNDRHLVARIMDQAGNEIYSAVPASEQVLDPNVARTVQKIQQDVLRKSGATAPDNGIGRPAAGKTGTTQNREDAWFNGYSPQIATAVWVGNPFSSRVRTGQFGGSLPAQLWEDYMRIAHDPLPVEDFAEPDMSQYRSGKKVGKFRSPPSTRSRRPTYRGGGGGGGGAPSEPVDILPDPAPVGDDGPLFGD